MPASRSPPPSKVAGKVGRVGQSKGKSNAPAKRSTGGVALAPASQPKAVEQEQKKATQEAMSMTRSIYAKARTIAVKETGPSQQDGKVPSVGRTSYLRKAMGKVHKAIKQVHLEQFVVKSVVSEYAAHSVHVELGQMVQQRFNREDFRGCAGILRTDFKDLVQASEEPDLELLDGLDNAAEMADRIADIRSEAQILLGTFKSFSTALEIGDIKQAERGMSRLAAALDKAKRLTDRIQSTRLDLWETVDDLAADFVPLCENGHPCTWGPQDKQRIDVCNTCRKAAVVHSLEGRRIGLALPNTQKDCAGEEIKNHDQPKSFVRFPDMWRCPTCENVKDRAELPFCLCGSCGHLALAAIRRQQFDWIQPADNWQDALAAASAGAKALAERRGLEWAKAEREALEGGTERAHRRRKANKPKLMDMHTTAVSVLSQTANTDTGGGDGSSGSKEDGLLLLGTEPAGSIEQVTANGQSETVEQQGQERREQQQEFAGYVAGSDLKICGPTAVDRDICDAISAGPSAASGADLDEETTPDCFGDSRDGSKCYDAADAVPLVVPQPLGAWVLLAEGSYVPVDDVRRNLRGRGPEAPGKEVVSASGVDEHFGTGGSPVGQAMDLAWAHRASDAQGQALDVMARYCQMRDHQRLGLEQVCSMRWGFDVHRPTEPRAMRKAWAVPRREEATMPTPRMGVRSSTIGKEDACLVDEWGGRACIDQDIWKATATSWSAGAQCAEEHASVLPLARHAGEGILEMPALAASKSMRQGCRELEQRAKTPTLPDPCGRRPRMGDCWSRRRAQLAEGQFHGIRPLAGTTGLVPSHIDLGERPEHILRVATPTSPAAALAASPRKRGKPNETSTGWENTANGKRTTLSLRLHETKDKLEEKTTVAVRGRRRRSQEDKLEEKRRRAQAEDAVSKLRQGVFDDHQETGQVWEKFEQAHAATQKACAESRQWQRWLAESVVNQDQWSGSE